MCNKFEYSNEWNHLRTHRSTILDNDQSKFYFLVCLLKQLHRIVQATRILLVNSSKSGEIMYSYFPSASVLSRPLSLANIQFLTNMIWVHGFLINQTSCVLFWLIWCLVHLGLALQWIWIYWLIHRPNTGMFCIFKIHGGNIDGWWIHLPKTLLIMDNWFFL